MTEQHQAEYGPVSEDDICNVNYFKTTGTNCNTVKFDFPKEEYCCKPCRDGQENPYPEHRNSCSNIATTTSQTEVYTTTQQTFTTASDIQIPVTDGTPATNQSDDPTSTVVPFQEDITTEQAMTTGNKVDPQQVIKMDDTTCYIIFAILGIIIIVLIAIVVYFYRKYKNSKDEKNGVLSASNGTNGDQLQATDPPVDDQMENASHSGARESANERTPFITPAPTSDEANDSVTPAPNSQQAVTGV
ncbi:uncharacterized protein LOC144424618 [Styela clava]